jgi:hypothetical protein
MKLPEPKAATRISGLPTTEPKVAVLFTKPETVLDDIRTAMRMADVDRALDPGETTILAA